VVRRSLIGPAAVKPQNGNDQLRSDAKIPTEIIGLEQQFMTQPAYRLRGSHNDVRQFCDRRSA